MFNIILFFNLPVICCFTVTCTQIQEEKGVFSEGEIMRIFCDMCEALAVLHHCHKPIIHRDMKVRKVDPSQKGKQDLISGPDKK